MAAGPELAAAVTNAGGLGVIGGVGYVGTSQAVSGLYMLTSRACVDTKNAQVYYRGAQGRSEG